MTNNTLFDKIVDIYQLSLNKMNFAHNTFLLFETNNRHYPSSNYYMRLLPQGLRDLYEFTARSRRRLRRTAERQVLKIT